MSHRDGACVSDNPNSILDLSGVPIKTEYWTDDSDSEDFQSTVSDSELPALEEPNLIVAYSYYENNSDVGNFNDFSSFNTQYTEQFSFKTSPNARRVSDDSRLNVEDIDDADVKPSAVVSSCYVDNLGANHQFTLQPNQHASSLPAGFDIESNHKVREVSGFGDGFTVAPVSTLGSAPHYNADTFVDSLLNDDFSCHDFSGHEFSSHYFRSNPFVTEDDEDKRNDYEYEQHEEVVEI